MNSKLLLVSAILAFTFTGILFFTSSDTGPEQTSHEIWDCTEGLCERATITNTITCEAEDGEKNHTVCRDTEEGLEDVTLKTDEFNHVNSPLTEEQFTVENQETPVSSGWNLEFLEDNRFLVSQTDGNLSLYEDQELVETAELEKTSQYGNAGLLGVVADPEFDENRYIYVYYYNEAAEPEEEDIIYNRASRFTFENGEFKEEKVLINRIEGNMGHSGGRVGWSPDGNIYVTTGDAEYSKTDDPEKHQRIQDLGFLGGKVLRVTPEGEVPEDNPFEDSYVYSLGHRNVQGIDFHPKTGEPFTSEHGPWKHDEINRIGPGNNYGWPGERCEQDYYDVDIEDETVDPVECFDEWTLAPSGTTFVDDPDHPWYGDLFVSGLRGNQIHRVVLDEDMNVQRSEVFFFNKYSEDLSGRIRDVAFNNGSLHILGDVYGHVKITPESLEE